MHPKSNNYPYLYTLTAVYQGSALAAGTATAGNAQALNLRASFALNLGYSSTSGAPTSGSVALALQGSQDGGANFAAVNDRSGNALVLTVPTTSVLGSMAVDTQYFPPGTTHVRVVPTVTLAGGSSPTVSFVAWVTWESFDHL